MGVKVKIQLKNIEERLKKLEKFDRIVLNSARRARKLIFQNWEKGKGADGKKFKALSPDYKDFKESKGRRGIRDLVLKGNMRNSFLVVKEKPLIYSLSFVGDTQKKKAEGNVKHAPNMLVPISDDINRKVQRLAFDLFTRG
jgi:hypothetical protein